jgi:hypothetical protein
LRPYRLVQFLVWFLCSAGLAWSICAPPTTAGTAKFCSPTAGSTVASPVTISASAATGAGQTIATMKLYVDNVLKTTVHVSTLSVSLPLASGSHALSLNFWVNGNGTAKVTRETFTVGAATTVAINVLPDTATLAQQAQQQFTATVTGTTNKAVQWLVDGVVGGSITAGNVTTTGLYTAPNATGAHQITAISKADTTKRDTSTISVGAQTGVSVSVTPDTASIAPGATQQLTAVVKGVTNQTLTWSVDGVQGGNATVGTISLFGLYTAPSALGSHNVTAVLNADTTKSDTSFISVVGTPAPSVSVTPATAQVLVGQQQQFSAVVQNSTSTLVDWYIDGTASGSDAVGTIDSSGLYTAPSTAGTHTVTAKLDSDPTVVGTAVATVGTAPPPPQQGVFTYAYDNGRTGANVNETTLTPANVSAAGSFGAKGKWTVDATMQAQPLYMAGVEIDGAQHNVLFVATENDSVYALDADVPGKTLWKRSFLTSTSTIGQGFTGGRTALGANVGITGTPVIDPATNRLYVLTRNTEGTNQVWRIRCISILDGTDEVAPTIVAGSVPGNGAGNDGAGNVPFNSMTQNQRPALLLQGGVVYVAFASFSDNDPYHGWLFAFDASTLTTLGMFNDSVNGGGGGFWMSGAGPSADEDGNVYVTTGNGRPDASPLFSPPTDSPNSVLKVKLNAGAFTVVDYFSPFNTNCLTNRDLDMASAAATLIPDKLNGHDALVTASKEGRVYLLDRNSLGQFQSKSDSQILDWNLFNAAGPCGPSPFSADSPWRVYGAPAYWNGSVYFGSSFGPLRQYDVTTGKFVQTALSTHTFAANGQSGRGPMVIVTANGTLNGIVWSVEDDLAGAGWIRAYDATNVAKQLYQVNYGAGTHFVEPMVINGNLYVTGHGTVYRYGLLH